MRISRSNKPLTWGLLIFLLGSTNAQRLELSTIKVTTIQSEPFLMLKNGCTKITKDCAEGFNKDLLDRLGKDLGFDYTLKEVDDGQYGTKKNSKWSGMIGDVVSQKADMAAGDLTLTSDRGEVVDFTTPYLTHSLSVLLKKLPDASSRGSVGVLAAFDILVWLLLIVAVIAVVGIFLVINCLSPYEGRRLSSKGKCPSEDADKFGLLGSLWFAFSNLCWQGFDRTPKSISGRVMTVFWWIFILLMIVSFTAGVTNYLSSAANRANELPVSTLAELSDAHDINIGCFKGGSTYQFFSNTSTQEYRALFIKMDDDDKNYFSSSQNALKRVKEGKYGAILEGPTAEYYEARNCELGIMPERISSLEKLTAYAYALRPGLPNLLKAVNKKILQYHSDGTLFKLYQNWWIPANGECQSKRKVQSRSMTIQTVGVGNVAVPFGILLIGVIAALITLVLEIFADKLPCFKDAAAPASSDEENAAAGNTTVDASAPTGADDAKGASQATE